jgi:hypothetical protein
MMRAGVMAGHSALFMVNPFISLVGVAICRSDGGFGPIFVILLQGFCE